MARREFETLTPQMFYILLTLKVPRHGYEIMNEVAKITNGDIQIGAGTLYTLLPRFENEDFIHLVKIEDKKKIYQITELGLWKLKKERKRMLKQIQIMEEIYHEDQ